MFRGISPFITLSHPYVYLIYSRLNIFKGYNDEWAIVAKVLGYNPRGDCISLELTYFGNCLKNLEPVNSQMVNSIEVYPVDIDSFRETVELDVLNSRSDYWLVRGEKLPLSHNKQDYLDEGIELKEYEPGEICAEEVGRLLIKQYADLFRATDEELYTCIPGMLKKIMVLDEWYHKEYHQLPDDYTMPDFGHPLFERLRQEIEEKSQMDFESFKNIFVEEQDKNEQHNNGKRKNNSPGSYETWQMLAKVIVAGDASFYKPTLPPNNHWKNWPDSGSM